MPKDTTGAGGIELSLRQAAPLSALPMPPQRRARQPHTLPLRAAVNDVSLSKAIDAAGSGRASPGEDFDGAEASHIAAGSASLAAGPVRGTCAALLENPRTRFACAIFAAAAMLGGMLRAAGVGAGAAVSPASRSHVNVTISSSVTAAAVASCSSVPAASVSVYTRSTFVPTTWRVVRRYPHDTASYTQGLAWHEAPACGGGGGSFVASATVSPPCNILFESRGMWGRSGVRAMALAPGASPDKDGSTTTLADAAEPPGGTFGEGLCLWPAAAVAGSGGDGASPPSVASGAVLVQLTWQDKRAFLFDPASLVALGSFDVATTNGEGWGLTHDGVQLIATDGSDAVLFWNFSWSAAAPAGGSVALHRIIRVTDASQIAGVISAPPPVPPGAPIPRLNELEYVHGWLLANIYTSNTVAIIDPLSGAAVAYFDFSALKAEQGPRADVLNGLAYTMTLGPTSPAVDGAAGEPWGGRLWVTGKDFQWLYEIELGGLQTPRLGSL